MSTRCHTFDPQHSIEQTLAQNTCVIYKDAAREWSTGNSSITSSPIVNVVRAFPNNDKIEVTVNLVAIRGPSTEPLHYHSSHLVGVVVKGHGWLMTASDNDLNSTTRAQISVGDVIIIPRGVAHLFQPDQIDELEYIALEFSDSEIDYQKHWRPSQS